MVFLYFSAPQLHRFFFDGLYYLFLEILPLVVMLTALLKRNKDRTSNNVEVEENVKPVNETL